MKTNKNAIDQTIIDDILWVSQPSAGLAAPDWYLMYVIIIYIRDYKTHQLHCDKTRRQMAKNLDC